MAEIKKALVEVEFNYACDTGDGGFLFFEKSDTDEKGVTTYFHSCSHKEDSVIYALPAKYPRVEYEYVDTTLIKAS